MTKDSSNLQLPFYKDCASIHYGCSKFGEGETVHWIGCVYWEDGEKKYFFANGDEESLIESFKDFLDKHSELTFLHWGMNSPQFGFSAIEKRYEHLTGKKIQLYPKFAKDLSEYLKEKYGIDYVNRDGGRLNNLAKLNGFSGYSESVEIKSSTEAAGRLELIFSIVQAESQGRLKIQSETKSSGIINDLEQFGFSEFLIKKGISRSSIVQLLGGCEPKEFFPCAMAILVKSGFFDHLIQNHFRTKEKAFETLGKIFGESARNAKGNINIIANPNSRENPDKYTSHRWGDKVAESLLG